MKQKINKMLSNWADAKIPGVYQIIIDNESYIGGTSRTIDTRIKEHIRLLRKNKHYNSTLQTSFNNNDVIKVKVLEQCNENVWKREQYYIDLLKPTANIVKRVAKYS